MTGNGVEPIKLTDRCPNCGSDKFTEEPAERRTFICPVGYAIERWRAFECAACGYTWERDRQYFDGDKWMPGKQDWSELWRKRGDDC